jgi:hypothetical protein
VMTQQPVNTWYLPQDVLMPPPARAAPTVAL